MKKIENNLFTINSSITKNFKTHLSISSGRDNGFNDYCATGRSYALRHSSTKDLVNKIFSNLNSNGLELFIIGHGSPGSLETGAGTRGYDYHKYIEIYNGRSWKPELTRLKDKLHHYVTIISCYTGAEESGSDLLFSMAKALGVAVMARTGLTTAESNGRIWYQAGSEWQQCLPDYRARAIRRTPPPEVNVDYNKIHLIVNKVFIEQFSNENIIKASFLIDKNEITFSTKVSQRIGSIIFNEEFHYLPGDVAGIITMRLRFDAIIESKEEKIEVNVYNDALAVIVSGNVCYSLPSDFRSMINS